MDGKGPRGKAKGLDGRKRHAGESESGAWREKACGEGKEGYMDGKGPRNSAGHKGGVQGSEGELRR